MVYSFKKQYMSDIGINALGLTSYHNSISLSYALDPLSGIYTRALVKTDRGSVDFYGSKKQVYLTDNAIHTESSANDLVDNSLFLHSGESWSVDFYYDLIREENRIILFDTGAVSVSFAPIEGGIWVDKYGIITKIERSKDGLLISLLVRSKDFTSHVVTENVSTAAVGSIEFEGTINKTITPRDTQGNPIPGITVTLNGISQVTDDQGQTTFDGLLPGSYQVKLRGTDYVDVVYNVNV